MFKKMFIVIFPTIALFSTLQSMSATGAHSSAKRKKVEQTRSARSIKMSSSESNLKRKRTNHMGAKLGTEFAFDNLSVHGRYQGAFQGVATVENEKQTSELIDYRREFRDRLDNNVSEL